MQCTQCGKVAQPVFQGRATVCRACYWVNDIRGLLYLIPDTNPAWEQVQSTLQHATNDIHSTMAHQLSLPPVPKPPPPARQEPPPAAGPQNLQQQGTHISGPTLHTIATSPAIAHARMQRSTRPPLRTKQPPWTHWCHRCNKPVSGTCVHTYQADPMPTAQREAPPPEGQPPPKRHQPQPCSEQGDAQEQNKKQSQ